jgi:CheY-like chemotaxis protein
MGQMMRVLIVEDDQDFVDELRITLGRLAGPPDVTVAGSRDSAYARLENEFFDLLILDLKIPTVDLALDADPAHGHAVFGRALNCAPGTPVFILTGSPVEDFVPEILAGKRHVDIWGEGREVGTVDILKKNKFSEAEAKLEPLATAVWELSEVELIRGDTELTIEDERLVRIFARRAGGVRCVVSGIDSGLSSAKVIRLKLTDAGGAHVHDAVAKLGSIPEVRDESSRFDAHISRLDPEATPRKLQTLEFGAKARAAIFYGLAAGFDLNGFEACVRPEPLASVPRRVQEATNPWRKGVVETPRRIQEIRRRLISDADFHRATAPHSILWLNDFENRQVQTHWCIVQGDLHGGNVLARIDGSCVLIDYGDVGEGPASLDPLTLEFSLLFHPKGPLRGGEWPTADQANHWADLDQYLDACPAANFIRACREWTHEVAVGPREIAAAAYSYLVRQLKYPDVDKYLTLALLESIHTWFLST